MLHDRTDEITIGEEAMEQEVRPKLELKHLIPGFTLQTADGRTVSTSQFKERKNLVILLFDLRSSRDWEALAEIKRRYPEFKNANAEVLAISNGPMEELKDCACQMGLPFDVLCDCRDEIKCAFCVYESTLFVADKFGELRLQASVTDTVDKALKDALTAVELAELECPECGVSTWPEFG